MVNITTNTGNENFWPPKSDADLSLSCDWESTAQK